MSNTTQCQRVLDYMRGGGRLTSLSALSELGVARLASRVHDLKEAGYEVNSRMVTKTNRYGEKSTFKEYWMEDSDDDQ